VVLLLFGSSPTQCGTLGLRHGHEGFRGGLEGLEGLKGQAGRALMTDFDEPNHGDSSKVQCSADSEADHPSDCYSSGDSGDEIDAEVPDVTDPAACTSNHLQGAYNLVCDLFFK